jgi:lipopolysaccharide transport system permease protein
LGPLWYLIQPLFTSVIFTLVFNNVAGIKTGSIPPFLFNLAGITIWNYFRECLTATSDTFKKNESIFGKVYFPRIIMPLSIIVSNLLKFGIQSLIFIAFYLYYVVIKHVGVAPNIYLLLFPLLVLCMAMLGLGLGMVISSMVTKYRDLTFLVSFGVQLLMYISLVVIPFSLFQEKGVEWLVKYNPMAYIIEFGRFMLLGEGNISQFGIIYTVGFSVLVLLIGTVIFNKTEKTFIDTI